MTSFLARWCDVVTGATSGALRRNAVDALGARSRSSWRSERYDVTRQPRRIMILDNGCFSAVFAPRPIIGHWQSFVKFLSAKKPPWAPQQHAGAHFEKAGART